MSSPAPFPNSGCTFQNFSSNKHLDNLRRERGQMCVCVRARVRARVGYENQFSALSSEGPLRSIIQLGLQPTNNSCSPLWKMVFGGGQAVHFLNNACAPTSVFAFNNARFSVSTGWSHAFSVSLFVAKSGTCFAGTNDITVKLLFCVCSAPSCHLYQRSTSASGPPRKTLVGI